MVDRTKPMEKVEEILTRITGTNISQTQIDEQYSERIKCKKCGDTYFLSSNNRSLRRKIYCPSCYDKKLAQKNRIDSILNIRKEIQRHLSISGVPSRFLKCSMENFIGDKIKASIKRFSFDSNLFLWSNEPGTGKTHLAVSQLRRALWHGIKIRFISSVELLVKLRSTFGENSEVSELEYLNSFSTIPLLAIDDIGTEKISDYVLQSIYMIIDKRYSEELPTIFTSNYHLNQISEKYGSRISSRIGSGKIINVSGKDMRIK